jgi:predicted thioesterase
VAPLLKDEELTVGTSVHIDHLAAAKVGEIVHATAELVSDRGRRLLFRIEGRSGKVVLARGLHERAIVNKAKFLAALASPS